jgi:hypothetical protein
VNFGQLTALIHQFGLSDHRDDILATVRPGILLKLGQTGSRHYGHSRIGGVPDLPPSISWPKDVRLDRYFCFLLQINLAQLPTFPENPLPKRGMFYLFADENENNANQLIYYSGDEPLQTAPLPENALMITDWYENLVEHCLEFDLFLDIPRWSSNDFHELCDRLNVEAESKLDDLGRILSRNSIGKLLGHVSGIGHDPREDAYVVREVNPEFLYNYEQRRILDLTQAQNWHNLLEIESSSDVDLMFGDAGYLQILIHGEDLKQQDFSRVYVNLESS